jgi:hypothetical protein
MLIYWTTHILFTADFNLSVSVCSASKCDIAPRSKRRMALSIEIINELAIVTNVFAENDFYSRPTKLIKYVYVPSFVLRCVTWAQFSHGCFSNDSLN